MIKKISKIILIFVFAFGALLLLSKAISNYRLHKYHNSVVNSTVYHYKNIDDLFHDNEQDTVYIFLYDPDSDDSIYLDEVLLKEISYDHNGQIFDEIYKVQYDQYFRSYIRQMIKNTFNIDAFPAIIALEKEENGYKKIDSFEYAINQEENLANLEAFLERNHFFDSPE